jgi:hypothetical protein
MRMTRIMTAGIFAAAGLVFLAASPARADEMLTATVPFDFIVGNSQLPAGEYVVTQQSDPAVLSIRSTDAKHSAFILTIPDSYNTSREARADLVFEPFGGGRFLVSIDGADGQKRDIPLTAKTMERELRAAQAASN